MPSRLRHRKIRKYPERADRRKAIPSATDVKSILAHEHMRRRRPRQEWKGGRPKSGPSGKPFTQFALFAYTAFTGDAHDDSREQEPRLAPKAIATAAKFVLHTAFPASSESCEALQSDPSLKT